MLAEDKTILSDEDLKKALAFLESKRRGDIVCPICKSTEWTIGAHIVQPVTVSPGNNGLMLGGVGYPQIMLISKECGHTLFINAVVAGIVPGGEAPKDEGAK
jgi:hypothetical protein